jgi:IgA-specific serine endopeptidase
LIDGAVLRSDGPSPLAQLTTADADEAEEDDERGGSSHKKAKAKTKKPAGTGGEDAKVKRKGGAPKKGKAPAGQRAKGSDGGGAAAGGGATPFALRSAIASPARYRPSAPNGSSSSSDDENRESNAPLGYYYNDSPHFVGGRLAEASTVAFVHEEKSAALEGEIRRLQRDVVHHRASEANLRAALDATTEAWKRESSISGGAGEDEIHERLAASFDAQAHLQEALSREANSRRAAEEECGAARKECASVRDDLERVKQDVNERLLAVSKDRDEIMQTLHRESAARQTADEACTEARLQLASMEAQLVRQSEEMFSVSARAQGNSDTLRNELRSARLEATQARARVEDTLSALAGAKEAELEARKSETNAVGYSSLLSTQLQALRDELDLTSEQQASFSAMISSNLRHANEELQRTTKERARQDGLLFQAKAECVEAKAECSSLVQKLAETETNARGEVDELRSALQASERRVEDAEKMLHTLSRAAVGPSLQPTEGGGVGGSAVPNRAREALELLGRMSTSVDFQKSSVEIAALDAAAAEVDMLQGMLAEESRKNQEGDAEAKFLAERLRELTGEEPSGYAPEASSLEAQMSEANGVRMGLEEQLAKAERDNSDLRRRVEELDRKCGEMASRAPGDESHPSAELAEAMQATNMADAQASMLRSCLEDTEEMLEESRAALRDMEQKLKSLKAAQPQQGSADTIRRAEEAESRLSATEARLEESEEVRSNMLTEHQEAVSAFDASLQEAEEAGNAMVAEHQQEKYACDVKLKETEIRYDGLMTEHQEAISAYEASLKEEEAARRVANSEVERLQAAAREYDANLESLREALHEAKEKSAVSDDMLQHAEHANRALEEQLAQSRAEMNSLRDELHQAQKDRFTIEETLNGSMHDIGEALAQKEDKMNQLDDMQDRLSSAHAKLADVESAKGIAVADAENARAAAEQALEQAQNAEARVEDAEARVEDAEARMELLREDLAAATADSQDAKEEVESLHLRLAHAESQVKADEEEAELREHESWLTSGVEPAAAREFSSVAVQASSLGSRLLPEHSPSSSAVRALETRLQAERDLNSRLTLDLDSAEIKAVEREIEAGELQATSDLQARRIDVLTAQLDALQVQVSADDAGEEQAVDAQQFGERLAEALSDANNLRSNLTSEGEARRVADDELARVRAELSTAEMDRKEAEAKAQAADAMIASLTSPEPADEKLQESVSLLQDEVARLKSEQQQVNSREMQYVAEMEKIISQRDDEASERAAAETAITKLQAQLTIPLEDDSKEAAIREHADTRAELMAALDDKSNELAEEMSRTETAEAQCLAGQEEIARLATSLQAATAAFDTEMSLQDDVTQLQAALQTEQTKRDELETQLEAADSTSAGRLRDVEKSLANTRSEMLEARQTSQRSVAELEATTSLMEEAQAAAQRSADEVKATKKKLTDAQQAAQRSGAEVKGTKKQLDDAREAAKRSADEVKATKKKLADLQQAAQRSADEVKATKNKLDDARGKAVEIYKHPTTNVFPQSSLGFGRNTKK